MAEATVEATVAVEQVAVMAGVARVAAERAVVVRAVEARVEAKETPIATLQDAAASEYFGCVPNRCDFLSNWLNSSV